MLCKAAFSKLKSYGDGRILIYVIQLLYWFVYLFILIISNRMKQYLHAGQMKYIVEGTLVTIQKAI